MRRFATALFVCFHLLIATAQERPLASGAADVRARLDQLQVVGGVLMIAAHPDDENTAVLAYFGRGRHLRAGYLSLTRGEGGQNLIGPEQGALMGVIRTQELLAARRLDGAQQFFTRAIDFGFSKTAAETLDKWGRNGVLADTVWVIRRFQPDVVILRFSGTPRDGHGHHQSSAILGKEAFEAAADPARFPEQLQHVQPWRAKRCVWNSFSFTRDMEKEAARTARMTIDTGQYDPLLGYSYGEIAGMSRSMHRSQGMGAAERKGSMPQYFVTVAGEPAEGDPLSGIDTTWNRLPGGAAVAAALEEASRAFDIRHTARILPALAKARPLVAAMDHPWARAKLVELDELAAAAAAVAVEASAAQWAATPGSSAAIRVSVVGRGETPVAVESLILLGLSEQHHAANGAPAGDNKPWTHTLTAAIPDGAAPTQPYWLREPRQGNLYAVPSLQQRGEPDTEPVFRARFRLTVGGMTIELTRPVVHRYVDQVRGELWRPFLIVPPTAVSFSEKSLLFPSPASRTVEITVWANLDKTAGEIRPAVPTGWRIEPASRTYSIEHAGEQTTLAFRVTPPASASTGEIAIAGAQGMHTIAYDHIPPQTVFTPASLHVTAARVKTLANRIGYVMGAGDEVPQALRQWGSEVTLLSADGLARASLSSYDAIVTGVRAYNTRPDLRANQDRLMQYVSGGGTLVVQYNVATGGPFGRASNELDRIGPYPLTVGRDRVTVEEAPLTPLDPESPLLSAPNRITPADYEGWVQERGLYFASKFDPRYTPLWSAHDPGEQPSQGGTLWTRYGKGVYVFTPMSWFRQLPAGVPGAHRIFSNLVSSGRLLAR
ncbi:MAG: PIG-L family deacetylase [Bryobacterales bacterium]|nr:PIG-L family deacetylase [Bryobacterales bacterium]